MLAGCRHPVFYHRSWNRTAGRAATELQSSVRTAKRSAVAAMSSASFRIGLPYWDSSAPCSRSKTMSGSCNQAT